jgi:hypothetical protein
MNNTIVKRFFLCLSLMGVSLFAKAQTIHCYFPQEYTVDADSNLIVSVKVDSLTGVGGFSFSVNWDSTVLNYVGVDSLGVDFNELSGFNESKTINGQLGFNWITFTAVEPLSLPDSTTLFSIIFEAVGEPDDTTSLRFSDAPNPREFANLDGELLASTTTNGFVTLTGTAATSTQFNSAPEKITLYPPAPNPFYENTLITFDLQQATRANVLIMDQLGRVVFEDQQNLPAGLQTMPVSKDVFPQSGTYYWVLHSRDFRVTQKIMFLNK